MASTFSPSLKLELIGTGDQSGTWGNTTNNNLGTLIEQAIAGVEQIGMTNVDYTLSSFNGIADEARNAVLVLTGTNSAVRNVIAPPVEKTYIISNNTAGGYAVNIKTPALAGVSIANGVTAIVYCNGAQFFPVTKNYASTNTPDSLVLRDGSGNFAANVITGNTVTQAPNDNSTKLASTEYVNAAAVAALQLIYPIGSIYTNAVNANNPSSPTLLGFGTWEAFGAGRVMVGQTGTVPFVAGTTGGTADATLVSHGHTFTGNQLADHSHTGAAATARLSINNIRANWIGSGGEGATTAISVNGASAGTPSGSISVEGFSATNANLQPYVVVYMWRRTG